MLESEAKVSIKEMRESQEKNSSFAQAAEEQDDNIVPTIEELIKRVEDFVSEDIRDIERLVLHEEDLQKFPEPQITSSDPYERRVARRLRIRNKLQEKRKLEEVRIKEELGEDDDEDEKYDPDNVVENQIESSTVRLLELIQDGRELISNVKVAAVSYEVKRRDKVRLERAERRDKLEQAAEEAKNKFMDISNQWAAVKSERDPLEIHAATEDQREKCMMVIAKKDAIIEDLKKELEEADANFVRDLERQEEEINILVDRINQQINIMRLAANNELELLEAAIAVEREEMMKANETEWEELIEKKEFFESETNILRYEVMEKHEKSIDAMETEQREQLKIKRTEQTKIIHDMQLQLQELEALCLFNSEKLNHNYRVLKKRADENQIIKSQQKRTITKLQDVLSSLRKKILKKETYLSNETKRLANELSSLNRNIKDMEKRASQLASFNNQKFLSLWDFNQSQVEEYMQKIVIADKVMYEQFLDITVPPLKVPTIRKEDLPSFDDGLRASKCEKGSEVEDGGKSIEEEIANAVDEKRVLKTILKSVSKYASFLIEENVKDVINNFSPADQVIVRLDKILTTVGVKNEDEIRLLVKHFLPYLFCKTCQERPPTESFESEDEVHEQLIVHYEDCHEEIIDEVIAQLRRVQEKEAEEDHEEHEKSVMETISSTVKDRITVIDMVVTQELSGAKWEQTQTVKSRSYDSQTVQTPKKRENIEMTPCDLTMFLKPSGASDEYRKEEKARVSAIGKLLTLKNDDKTGLRHLLGLCLQEKHDISIDRLLLVKALRTYSKELNNRTQVKNSKSVMNNISHKWMTSSRRLTNEDILKFWKNYDIISMEKEQLWDTFIEGLKEYHKELTERARLDEEIRKVKRSNNDLMRLLQRYLSISTEEKVDVNFPKVKQYFPCPDETVSDIDKQELPPTKAQE